jgi:hypothetical protein
MCQTKPTDCSGASGQVCGCNNVTYPSECAANQANVPIKALGECASAETCSAAHACSDPDEFCKFPTGTCGAPGVTGVCTPFTTACSTDVDYVCGCDGFTYVNPCFASRFGASIASSGLCNNTCEGPPDFVECPAGQFCNFTPDLSCIIVETYGRCDPLPDINSCGGGFFPVCGCDGLDYFNECEANALGVPVAFFGFCSFLSNANARFGNVQFSN